MLKAPRMRSSDVRLMLQEQYETLFDIYDHKRVDANPLALVMVHPAENVSSGGAIELRIEEFVNSDVTKYTGMSLMEFFNCPREYCDLILKAARKRQAKESAAMNNLPQP